MQNQTLTHKSLDWIDITEADSEVTSKLGQKYGFHQLDLDDVLSDTQRSKIDEYDDYLFLVLHLPLVDQVSKRIRSVKLNIFLSKERLITIHDKLPEIQNLFEECKSEESRKEEFMNKSSSFLLYKLLDRLFNYSFDLLDELNRTLSKMENEVFEYDFHRDNLREILLLKKDIINFRRIIIPQRTVIAQLEHKTPEKLNIYFDDLVDKIEKIWSMLETMKELVESLHETNETIISHNTNNIMKVLTVFSAVMLPLTLITGFYGMNLALPWSNLPGMATFLAVGMLLMVAGMLGFMKYKRWF